MTAVRARWTLVLLLAVAAVAVLALTACSSSDSSDSDANSGDSEQALLGFAQCMRDNGVPGFPDPVARPNGTFGLERPQGVSPSVLDDALASCRLEAQAAGLDAGSSTADTDAQDQLLELSRCMRKNGIREFPDPEPGTDAISGLHSLFADYDLESPRVAKALQSCQSVLNQLFGPGHGR